MVITLRLATIFPRNLAMVRFYFKALVGVATIRVRLDIECSDCRDQQTCGFDNQQCRPFVHMDISSIVRAHTYTVLNPLPCGEISRAAFIGMIA